jgi:hypothetical protein
MATPTRTLTYTDINAFCKQTYDKTFVKEIWDDTPLKSWLWANRETDNWGPFITNPVQYNSSTSGTQVMGMTAWHTITVQDDKVTTVAQWDPALYERTAGIKKQDEMRNKGTSQIVSWIQAKYEFMHESMGQYISTELWSGAGGDHFVGLATAISQTPTVGTYAGIDRTDATYQPMWSNQISDQTLLGGLGGLNLNKLLRLYNLCGNGGSKHPNFCVTSELIWEKIWAIVDARNRLTSWNPNGTTNIGWDAIEFNGMKIVMDRDCPAGSLFMLNDRFVKLRTYPDADMTVTPWEKVPGSAGVAKTAYLGGGLCVLAPNRCGVMFGLT